MDVSVIITNYKTSHLAKDAIKTIIEKSVGFSYEIVIVDNSEDEKEFKQLMMLEDDNIHVIKSDKDLGFGKANNLGVEHACGEYVCLLNTDILLINNAIFEMLEFIRSNENVGIVGANLYGQDMQPTHSFMRQEKNLKNELKDNSIFSSFKRKFLTRKRDDFNYSPLPVRIYGYITGAALMMRRDDFLDLNGFDKDIYLYAEEALLCFRLVKEKKKEMFNVPSAKIIHLEGGSFKARSIQNASEYINGTYIYYLKAYDEQEAISMLKSFEKIYRQKAIVMTLLNKQKANTFKNLSIACKKKLSFISLD